MHNQDFKDQVVIITGSSKGIGKALAVELSSRGAMIVINGRNQEHLYRAYNELRGAGIDLLAVQGDVTSIDDCQKIIEKTIEHYGKIDILINNAGISSKGSVIDHRIDIFEKVLSTNFLGSFILTKAAIPYVREQQGSIIFISSIAGLYGMPGHSAYCASKMGLTALAQSLRMELHGSGVHIGIVYLGFTENEPDKKYYNVKGDLEILPRRDNVRIMPVETVARKIANDIKKRKFRCTYSFLGKLFAFLNRHFPDILDWLMIKFRKRMMESLKQ